VGVFVELTRGAAVDISRYRGGDGTYRWFLARYYPMCVDQGQPLPWYVACTDIEDRERAEAIGLL
jgi:PAS domain-containing protein